LAEINTSLTNLDLTENNIELQGGAALANNSTLIALSLSGNEMGDEGAEVFAKKNTSLRSLDLTFSKISNKGAIFLAKSSFLKNLILASNRISDAGALPFTEKNNGLEFLDLTGNDIQHEGEKALEAWGKKVVLKPYIPKNSPFSSSASPYLSFWTKKPDTTEEKKEDTPLPSRTTNLQTLI
jgi:Leucine-rich repeat (LRR) protein